MKKILFYSIVKKNYLAAGGGVEQATICRDIVNYALGLNDLDRQYDLASTRFCRLESSEEQNNVQKILFKSATHKYRAPLINRESGAERENPKLMEEGERIKTHVVIRYKRDGVALYLESGIGTLKMQQIINYLNTFANKYHAHNNTNRTYSLEFEIIVKDNFLTELNRLNRVIEGELFVDKQILGSESLDYSNRIQTVKHDLKLTIKAERGSSIVNTLSDAFNKLNGGRSTISKIRVKGKNENDNDVIIDTDLIAKSEFVDVEIHETTGEVNSQLIFEQMRNIALAI